MFKFDNGVTVKDRITGFQGVVTGRTNYITGCNQIMVNPQKINTDGKLADSEWFDENRLQLLAEPRIVLGVPEVTGDGPMEAAPKK